MINVKKEMQYIEDCSEMVQRHGVEFAEYDTCIFDAIGSIMRDYQNEMYCHLSNLLMYSCLRTVRAWSYEYIDENQFEAIEQLCKNWKSTECLCDLYSELRKIVENKND